MKVAAIYARVSSDKQREEKTIASQTAALVAEETDSNLGVAPTEVHITLLDQCIATDYWLHTRMCSNRLQVQSDHW